MGNKSMFANIACINPSKTERIKDSCGKCYILRENVFSHDRDILRLADVGPFWGHGYQLSG